MLPYVVAVFTGAFLLFQVQPLIAKYILPWFGGGPAVWTTSMLFFQVFLLGGYAYAHLSIRRFRPRLQAGVHIVLLLLALTWLPITPASSWQPTSASAPTWRILLLLTGTIGLPYFLLSSTAPLMQAWFSRTSPGASPYRLYALSNVASLLALLSYPFVVEPALPRNTQATVWSFGFGLFVVVCSFCAVWAWRKGALPSAPSAPSARNRTPDDAAPPPSLGTRILWLGWPACAALLLLAVTNQITLDVAVIPFLWVLPLSLYLLSFIICFASERWYARPLFAAALVPAMVATVWIMFLAEEAPVVLAIGVYSAGLFVCCMVCHGEVSRLKPNPRYLTGYYLMIALGGALGGAFVAIVAPLIFDDYYELHLGLLAVCALALIAFGADRQSVLSRGRPVWAWTCLIVAYLVLAVALSREVRRSREFAVAKSRNFYGALTVGREHEGTSRELLWLRNGASYHGAQFTAADKRRLATTYYSERSGAAQALRFFLGQQERRIGIIGLGVGTLSTYGRKGDYIRIYEINPEVIRIAETFFTYLAESPARVDVIVGDARLSMEREPPQEFDVLIVDAFTSDAIPVHLLTKEAFEIYQRHIQPQGVIAFLISSWHLDLEPVVRRLAEHFDLEAAMMVNAGGPWEDWGSRWMLVTRNREFLNTEAIAAASSGIKANYDHIRLWTDDYTSPFQVLER